VTGETLTARDAAAGAYEVSATAGFADTAAALAGLHRSLPVGARVVVSFPGHSTDAPPGDWDDGSCFDVLRGAGFDDLELRDDRPRSVRGRRARSLADTVAPGMRLLVCGLNPSVPAADAGVGFVTPGNRFWPAALCAGLASVDRDPAHALRWHGTGMTDLVKRATRRADELGAHEYREGVTRVERLCARLRPRSVCVVGLAGWRAAVDRRAVAGWQQRGLGGSAVYLMPSTSGLNARSRPEDLIAHLRAALHPPFSTKYASGTGG
jgi:double-stranded uracil-DNA glycosylase